MQENNTEKNDLQKILSKIPKKKALGANDTVLGTVLVVKDKIVVVAISESEDKSKVLSPADTGVIFVKDISKEYVESPFQCFKKGDFIRAKIIEVTPFEYKLKTSEDNLGVISSNCNKCGKELNLKDSNGKIRCLNCGNIESKKVAK